MAAPQLPAQSTAPADHQHARAMPGSVGSDALQTDSVTSAAIAPNAVGSSEIATDAVGSDEIAANAVGSSELADNAVDTAAIADNAVTNAKMADGSVNTAELVDGSVSEAKLGTDVAKGIVGYFTATGSSGTVSVDTVTDMVLTNVPVIINHRYALHFHGNVLIGAGAGAWSVACRANGTAIGRYAEGLTTGSRDVDGTIYWTASATQSTDDFDILLDETTDGSSATIQAGATAPRWFTMTDLGIV